MKVLLSLCIIIMLLIGIYDGFVAVNKKNKLGYKGPSFYYFGLRIWKFTNRVFGLLLIVGSLYFFITNNMMNKQRTSVENTNQVILLLVYVMLAFVITEILAFIVMYNKKNKGKKIKQF